MSWKKKNSKIAHKNPWYLIREDDVIRPDGKPGKYFVIEDKSVAVVAEDKDGEIFLVGQTRYPIGNIYSWEIVTGRVEKSENYLKAAKKELEEEAGLLAKKWISLGYFYVSIGTSSEKCKIFLAKNLTKTKTDHEPTEDITVKKEKLEKIIKMIKKNKIFDSLTIVAIYKYLFYKK